MENIKKQNIGEFVKAVNSAIENNEDLKQALNEAVKKALPKEHFQNLNEFVDFLPNTIKEFFDSAAEEYGTFDSLKTWQNCKIQDKDDKDLEKLYKINLEPKTKTAIIEKFNIFIENNDSLSTQQDVKKALSTLKKILGKGEVSVSVFCDFIYYNFSKDALSNADLDDIVDYVKSSDDDDKFKGWKFWFMCNQFKEQPSEKFMDFIVENTDFTKLEDDQLICSIIVLVHKHPKYQKDKNKDNMVEALKDILCGNGPYKKFSEALAKVDDIGTKIKIKLDSIEKITDEDDNDVAAFAKELGDNNIEITFENNSFAVETKKTTEKETIKETIKIKENENIKINESTNNNSNQNNNNNEKEPITNYIETSEKNKDKNKEQTVNNDTKIFRCL